MPGGETERICGSLCGAGYSETQKSSSRHVPEMRASVTATRSFKCFTSPASGLGSACSFSCARSRVEARSRRRESLSSKQRMRRTSRRCRASASLNSASQITVCTGSGFERQGSPTRPSITKGAFSALFAGTLAEHPRTKRQSDKQRISTITHYVARNRRPIR